MTPDNIIWEKIAQNDQRAYKEAYYYFFDRFYNYGIRFTLNSSLIEDAIQETLLLLWVKRKEIPFIRYPGTYFYGAFRNRLFDKIRNLQKTHSAELITEPEFCAEQMIIERETNAHQKENLERALGELTPRQREAVFLRFYEELPYAEVASILAITTKAAYKIVARALMQMREVMCLSLLLLLLIVRL